MVRRSALAFLGLAAVAIAFLFTPTGEVVSQRVSQVFVTNFPQVWQVDGKLQIEGPVLQSRFEAFRDITLPPVRREDTTRFLDAGYLVTDGFPNVVLSLHGLVKGHVANPGAVGAILIPDEKTVQEAFEELGMMHFFLETAANGVSSKTPYFASNQPRYTVAFPAYRILLYNTTDKTVNVNVFAYLTD